MNFDLFELVLVGLVVFTYWPALRGGWVFDDWSIYDAEHHFQKSIAWRLAFIAGVIEAGPFTVGGGAARWFTYLVYHVTYRFWGFAPAAWHGVSIAMHAAAVVILNRLALLWGFSPGQAAGAAAQTQLETLLATGASYEQVTLLASGYEAQLRKQLEQVGITGEAQDEYIRLLGLTPEQVTTAIQLSRRCSFMAWISFSVKA